MRFSRPGSWARGPEQPLTKGGLEQPCLDGLLVVVLANHSNAVITKQQSLSLQRGLRNRRKKQPAPLIELSEEFFGTQYRAGRVRSLQELAKRDGISRRYIRRLIGLAFLSPQLVEAILQGRQPVALTATRLTELDLPLDWTEQQKLLAG